MGMIGADENDQPDEPGRLDYDIGDVLAVDPSEQLDHDDHVPEEVSPDEGDHDFTDVPEGDVVVLSTAEPDSPVRS